MAIIGNSGGAVTLTAATTTIAGTITGSAPAYAAFYAALYGPGATNYDVTITGAVSSSGSASRDAGILLATPGEITNTGLVAGGAGIVIAGYRGAGYIRNTALIEATAGAGIYVYGKAGVNNSGIITAAAAAVELRGGGVLNNAGTVAGAAGAVLATYFGTGAIENTGLIRGTAGNGAILAGTLANRAPGTITGSADGVYLYASGGASNAGQITGGLVGLAVGGSATAALTIATTIENAGAIKGGSDGIALLSPIAAPIIINNDSGGRISGGAYGIAVTTSSGAAPSVQLGNAGLITGGVSLLTGAIVNTGTIDGTIAAYLKSGTIFNGNRIAGRATGAVLQTGSIAPRTTIYNGATLTISVTAAATLINTGYISGNQDGVILLKGGIIGTGGEIIANRGTAILSDAALRLTNTGLISGATIAVQATGGAYIINTADITAGNDGILLTGAASLYNYGLISSATAAAITAPSGYIYNAGIIEGATGITLPGASQIINAATGTVAGTTAIALSGAGTLYNYGRIDGGLTAALNSYIYNSGKIVAGPTAGFSLYGYLYGAGAINLGAGTAHIGGTVAGGQRINFTGGAEVLNLSSPTQFHGKLTHFALTDTIDLTTIPRANILSETFAAGTLTLRESIGSIALTFANPGSFSGDTFALFADGTGTGITLIGAAAALPAYAPSSYLPKTSAASSLAAVPSGWLTAAQQSATAFIAITL